MKVTSTVALSEHQMARLRAVSDDLNVIVARSPEEQEASLPDTDVIFGRCNSTMLERAKEVKWVQSYGVGVDYLLGDPFVSSPIPLVNAKGTLGVPLAEHAWALILALTRGIAIAVRQRRWESRYTIRPQIWELPGKTLGIVGLGSAGTEVARRAAAFGMEVIATKKRGCGKAALREPGVEARSIPRPSGPLRYRGYLRAPDPPHPRYV